MWAVHSWFNSRTKSKGKGSQKILTTYLSRLKKSIWKSKFVLRSWNIQSLLSCKRILYIEYFYYMVEIFLKTGRQDKSYTELLSMMALLSIENKHKRFETLAPWMCWLRREGVRGHFCMFSSYESTLLSLSSRFLKNEAIAPCQKVIELWRSAVGQLPYKNI